VPAVPALHTREAVPEDDLGMTDRIRVPGGWLYRNFVWDYDRDAAKAVCTTFVPDPASGFALGKVRS
jgi:hypothetical protein